MTKQFFASIMVLTLVAMVVGVVAQAGTEATVNSTVTAELISVSVANGTVAYGILPVNTSKDTLNPVQTQVVTNDGNVNVDLEVKSSDADGGGTPWNLVAAVGSIDEFTHEFSSNGGTGWTSFAVDNNAYTSLTTGVSGNQDLDLRIKTPTSVSDNDEKTITVTVLATKS